MVPLGDEAQEEARFSLFEDCFSVGARKLHGLLQCTIGSKIILDAPNGTPR
jgi:hypothetical protein